MNELIVRSIKLPYTIGGITAKDENGDYNIYTNALLSIEMQKQAYLHEVAHIQYGHFYDDTLTVEEKELEVKGCL